MLAGVGGQHGWREPIHWICVSVWSGVASGETCRAVAELYDVSVASVVKWSQR